MYALFTAAPYLFRFCYYFKYLVNGIPEEWALFGFPLDLFRRGMEADDASFFIAQLCLEVKDNGASFRTTLKMFPQISEEPENILAVVEEGEDELKFEDAQQEEDGEDPSFVLPKIVTEDVDKMASPEGDSAPVVKGRMRSLSGGAYRLAPLPLAGRMRRQSGDDVLTGVSPSRRAALFEAFRPRSKSDSKSKKPTFLSSLKNSMLSSSPNHTSPKTSPTSANNHLDAFVQGDFKRPRSGSDTRSGPMSKVIDMFRGRSNSVDLKLTKKLAGGVGNGANSGLPTGALLRRHSVDPERRRSGGAFHRSLDGCLEHHTALIHRDHTRVHGSDSFNSRIDIEDLGGDEDLIFVKFFKNYKCYHLMPTSAKLVIFDTRLPVKKAFYALVENGIRAAPLWDFSTHKFVGMLTITDFINILRTYYNSPEVPMDDLEEQDLETWRNVLKEKAKPLVSISPDHSLFEAIKTLVDNKVHRLPIIDPITQNVLYVITHKRLLKFLFLHFNNLPHPSYLNQTLEELKIGTFENIATASRDTTVIAALNKFIKRRVSALPVIHNDEVVDIYAKFDVINLAAEKTYDDLDATLIKALEHRGHYFEGVLTCTKRDTLLSVMERIVKAEVHRLVVINENKKVEGIISLSDILKYLVLRPEGIAEAEIESLPESEESPSSDFKTPDEGPEKLIEEPDENEF